MENNKIIDEDFTKREGNYYARFYNPENKIIEIHNIDKIVLERTSGDSVQLKIKYDGNKSRIYHYVNEYITLLNKFDIGIK